MDFFAPLVDSTLEFVRDDIILQKDTLYFDWTASGLESKAIQHRICSILPRYANTHSNTASNANFMMDLYHNAKQKLKEYLGLSEDFIILPSGFGATSAMKRWQEICGFYMPPKLQRIMANEIMNLALPVVLIGPYEHHSNEISLREALCKCIRIPLCDDLMDLEMLDSILKRHNDSMLFASMNIASNVSGIVLPYEIIANKLRTHNAHIAFDLATMSPHSNIDSNLFDSAFLSPHKLLGGIGSCGILCARSSVFDLDLAPTFSGGGTIKYASADAHYYIQDIELREDYGTPHILGLLKAALAYQYRNEMGISLIQKREKVLYEILINELQSISGIQIYGIDNNASHIPVISFNVESISPYDLAYELSYNYHIETRAGCSCAGSYGHYLTNKETIKNIIELDSNPSLKPAWLRVSLHYSHNFNDIEYLINALKKSIARLR